MSVETAEEIEKILRDELGKEEPKNTFRKIFCDLLGFEYGDTLFKIDAEDLLKENLIVIAKTNPPKDEGEPFYVLYGEMEKILKTMSRKLQKVRAGKRKRMTNF